VTATAAGTHVGRLAGFSLGYLFVVLLERVVARVEREQDGYAVEVGGQVFTQAQWEAVHTYAQNTSAETAEPEPEPRRAPMYCKACLR
jgi:hypothetical protein